PAPPPVAAPEPERAAAPGALGPTPAQSCRGCGGEVHGEFAERVRLRVCRRCWEAWRYFRRKRPSAELMAWLEARRTGEPADVPAPSALAEPQRWEEQPTPARLTVEERLIDHYLASTDWSNVPLGRKRRAVELLLEAEAEA
ncbi:MAG: hypothetical protein ACRD2H_05085, partial [Terriglobales bacterium]